jgi:alcohol dehydrogenase class IV
MASPVPTLAAREAARLTDVAYAGDGPEEDVHRDQLALAALLSGYAIDAAHYGLHHVMSQTLVRVGGAGHGAANAALLPHTIGALERRRPGYVDPDESLRKLALTLARLAGADGIRNLGVDRAKLADCARAAAQRAELQFTPPPADEAELLALYEAAW